MTRLAGFDIAAPPLVMIPIMFAALVLVALGVGRLMGRLTRRWFSVNGIPGDQPDLKPPHVGWPITVAVLAAGMLLLGPELAPRGGVEARWFSVVITVLLVASSAMALTRLAVSGVSMYALRRPSLAPATSVARMAARIAIAILAILTGLQWLGVPVTPLLTTLGIGSLAVALALQDTLANFFAGLYLLADRPVRPGDYIKLAIEGGAEGYVDSIGWRSSRLRTLVGNTVIVPNQKLSQTILTNYHLPQTDMVLSVLVRVPFEADAEAVERHLYDEMKHVVAALPKLIHGDPIVRLANLDDPGMVFQCTVGVRDFEAQGLVGHALRKAIVARLKKEGIALGYPQQVVRDRSDSDRGVDRPDFPGRA